MRYLKQIGILIGISFLGEVLEALLPLPLTAGIYGVIILFSVLALKLLQPEDISNASSLLIRIMPVMFIPAAAGIMDTWEQIRPSAISFCIIIAASTVVTIGASGLTTQRLIRRKSLRCEDE